MNFKLISIFEFKNATRRSLWGFRVWEWYLVNAQLNTQLFTEVELSMKPHTPTVSTLINTPTHDPILPPPSQFPPSNYDLQPMPTTQPPSPILPPNHHPHSTLLFPLLCPRHNGILSAVRTCHFYWGSSSGDFLWRLFVTAYFRYCVIHAAKHVRCFSTKIHSSLFLLFFGNVIYGETLLAIEKCIK